MDAEPNRLAQIKPLSDPLRVVTAVGIVMAVLTSAEYSYLGHLWTGMGFACLLFALALLIAPHGRPNVIYLRAFRTDKSTAELRAHISAALGSTFRMAGIRAPRERTSVLMRFSMPGLFGLKYAGSKLMDLEAGEDWMARLWRTFQTTRLVLIDARDLTSYLQDEIQLTLRSVGESRVVFVVTNEKPDGEWRRLLADAAGPEYDPAQFKLLHAASEPSAGKQMVSALATIVEHLPPGVPGETEQAKDFVLSHVSAEVLNRSGSSAGAKFAALAGLLMILSLGPVLSLISRNLVAILVVACIGLVFMTVLLIRGMFRLARRGQLLQRAGHHADAARTGLMVATAALLCLASVVLIGVEPARKIFALKSTANELTALISMQTINTAQLTYSTLYPERGFACQLSALGPADPSGVASPDAAQLIPADLAAGTRAGYKFVLSGCIRAAGSETVSGYRLTAIPFADAGNNHRGFCTSEGRTILYDPRGGTNCKEPVQ